MNPHRLWRIAVAIGDDRDIRARLKYIIGLLQPDTIGARSTFPTTLSARRCPGSSWTWCST
jgi:hypothetical protein